MSEYWKSTPKYWCKHCKVYVRDTKLEKTNHEATPRHQGNLKRFLRDLHRGHEKDEKDKERAKAEVARLNGVVSGLGLAGSSSSTTTSNSPRPPKQQATPAQRKQQLAQLVEMGVSIPEEFRAGMAMAGEWQVTSERLIAPDGQETKLDGTAFGVRKRPLEEQDEGTVEPKKTRWGSAFRTHLATGADNDLDVLLENATRIGQGSELKKETKEETQEQIKLEPLVIGAGPILVSQQLNIKREPSNGEVLPPPAISTGPEVKRSMEEAVLPSVVFKKRKVKNIRQK